MRRRLRCDCSNYFRRGSQPHSFSRVDMNVLHCKTACSANVLWSPILFQALQQSVPLEWNRQHAVRVKRRTKGKESVFWKEHAQSKKQKTSITRELQAAISILIISDRGLRFGPANSLRESLNMSNKLPLYKSNIRAHSVAGRLRIVHV